MLLLYSGAFAYWCLARSRALVVLGFSGVALIALGGVAPSPPLPGAVGWWLPLGGSGGEPALLDARVFLACVHWPALGWQRLLPAPVGWGLAALVAAAAGPTVGTASALCLALGFHVLARTLARRGVAAVSSFSTAKLLMAALVGPLLLGAGAEYCPNPGDRSFELYACIAGMGVAAVWGERIVKARFRVSMPASKQFAKFLVGSGGMLWVRWATVTHLPEAGLGLVASGFLLGLWLMGGVPFLAREPRYPAEGGAPAL